MTCFFSSMIPNSESRVESLSLDVHRRVSDDGQSGVIGIRRNDLGGQHHHQQHQQQPQHHMLQQLTVPTSPPVIVNEMMQGIFSEILFQSQLFLVRKGGRERILPPTKKSMFFDFFEKKRAQLNFSGIELRKGMLNLLVRLGKAQLSFNNEYCHNLLIITQGPLKFSSIQQRLSI